MKTILRFKTFGVLLIVVLGGHCLMSPSAEAAGILERLRAHRHQTLPARSSRAPAHSSPSYAPSSSRNLDSRSRLPAGRSYYQGRYYGNFNNRFYGPQYGYF